MTKIVGITGGIGSGKSTLIEYVKNLGYSVYIADFEAKNLMNQKEIINKIQFLFDTSVLTKDKLLDRKKLSKLVFNNPENLAKLNGLIHPLVKEHFREWVLKSNEKIVFKEAAILFESGSYKDCDYTILITAPQNIRVQRVMLRDGVSEQEVLERMNNQWSDEEKAKLADFTIQNIDLEVAKKQITEVINRINK